MADIQLYIAPQLEAYRGFHNDEWAQHMMWLCKGTGLEAPIFNLIVTWKAASSAHEFPFLLVEGMASTSNTMAATMPAFAARLVGEIEKIVDQKTMHCGFTDLQKRIFHDVLQTTRAALVSGLKDDFSAAHAKVYWENIVQASTIKLALWGSERLAYVGVYAAYEQLITTCVRVKRHDPRLFLPNAETIGDALEEEFTKQFRTAYWDDELTDCARLVRNSIMHNGGKISRKLETYKDKIVRLEDNTVGISAHETTNLYEHLKQHITSLVPIVLQSL